MICIMICRFYYSLLLEVEKEEKLNMAESTRKSNKSAPFTAQELDAKRAKYKKLGLPKSEINARLNQAVADRRSNNIGAVQQSGLGLKPSRKSEVFRPAYNVRSNLPAEKEKRMRVIRAQNVEAEILSHQRAIADAKRHNEFVGLRAAFKKHPKEANLIRSKVLGSEHEEKHRKHARREMARELTGVEKGSWWDPILKFGADMAPKLLPLLLGMGDYTDPEDQPIKSGDVPASNSFLAASSGGQRGYEVPFMHSRGEKTRVTHREYIGDVYSTTSAFVAQSFPLNPGMEEMFPWLAPVANSYTNYRLCGAVCDFVSQGSDYANTAGLGYVAYATQYNPLAPDFLDKRELLNYEFADAVKPSRNMTHWVECKPSDIPCDEKTIRSGSIPANADLRLYDHGKFFIAVGGNTASGSIIGQFWCSYDVEFYFPKISSTGTGNSNYWRQIRSGAAFNVPLGNAVIANDPANTFVPATLDPNTFAFPLNMRGRYRMTTLYDSGGAATGIVNSTIGVTGTGIVIVANLAPANNVATQKEHYHTIVFDVINDTGVLVWSNDGTAIPGTPSNVDITVVQIPRPPPASTEIFDYLGQEQTQRYESFMSSVRAKELTAMGIKLSEFAPVKDALSTSDRWMAQFKNLFNNPPSPWVLESEYGGNINEEYFSMRPAIKGPDKRVIVPFVQCSPNSYSDSKEADLAYDRWMRELVNLSSVLYPMADMSKIALEPTYKSSSTITRVKKDDAVFVREDGGYLCFWLNGEFKARDVGICDGIWVVDFGTDDIGVVKSMDESDFVKTIERCRPEYDTPRPKTEGNDGEDPYTVLRRVGSYGVCSTIDKYGGDPMHFVVRSFDRTKWKWWFLEEPDPQFGPKNPYETVFLETYEDLNGKEFCDAIDVIIDARVKPDREIRSEVETKVGRFLFRKRGSKDFSQHAQPK